MFENPQADLHRAFLTLTIGPQSSSMSSAIRWNEAVLVAILIQGAGLNPETDPGPAMKRMVAAATLTISDGEAHSGRGPFGPTMLSGRRL